MSIDNILYICHNVFMKATSYVYVNYFWIVYLYLIYVSMKKSKILISAKVLDTIAWSWEISEKQKLTFLKYVGYLTHDEQRQLCQIL
jgi:hypothetical protein